jgi:type VI secretion system ImpH/TssG family protein
LSRARAAALTQLIERLGREPYSYDFFQILRRIEALYRDRPERPRLGAALRPADEPIRLGQDPSLSFAPAALSVLRAGKNGAPPLLAVHFFGLMGPNGPLPLHLTEYVRDRMRNSMDPTMSRFLDLFHHRMLMFFYRAWASARATVSADSPQTNRFLDYDGALSGRGTPSLRNRTSFPIRPSCSTRACWRRRPRTPRDCRRSSATSSRCRRRSNRSSVTGWICPCPFAGNWAVTRESGAWAYRRPWGRTSGGGSKSSASSWAR